MMYYTEPFFNEWVIKKYEGAEVDVLIIGPFQSEADAYFICELLNAGKLKVELGLNGEKSIEDTNTVY